MPSNLVSLLALITGVALIVLVILMYIRSRQGDQRAINLINVMLLPLLSAIVITVSMIFAANRAGSACTGAFATLRDIGVGLTILLILVGLIRFFATRPRDRRLVTHPVLLAVAVMTIVFLAEFLNGCIY